MTTQTTEILRILTEHPAEIESETNRYYALTLKEQDLQRSKARVENDTYRAVHAEETPDGKKAYTNEQLRTAEVERRLANDEAYQTLRDEEHELYQKKHECNARVDRLKREHRGAVAAVSILNSKIEDQE